MATNTGIAKRRYFKTPQGRALQGVILATGAPLGWMFVQFLRGVDVPADIAQNPVLYSYMLLGTGLVFAIFGFYVGRQERFMRVMATRDSLTGLYNLRYFREALENALARASRHNTPVSLIYFDLDHFKRVNDTYGHAAGDVVLQTVAEEAAKCLRKGELLARVGGEEFAVLLSQADLAEAEHAADRILNRLRGTSIKVGEAVNINATASLGVVMRAEDEAAQAILDRADQAMYAAKQAGRDRVMAA